LLSQMLVSLWWLGFWTAIGLCLGSFLNVVIYRLPRNRSLREPLWSACPYCGHRIRWYDNLPIVSFILLRGRCRDCRSAISTQYVVIEASMALVVLILVDAFVVGHVRAGLSASEFGLTDRLASDWPIVVAHVGLFACLLSMSAIDLEHYWVDVRFTNLATLGGFLMHALWTPKHSAAWVRPYDTTAVMSLFAFCGLGVVWLVFVCRPNVDPEDFGPEYQSGEAEGPPDDTESAPSFAGQSKDDPLPPLETPSRLLGFVTVSILIVLLVWLVAAGAGGSTGGRVGHAVRALVPLAFFFFLIVREGTVARASDEVIMQEIEEERHGARRMVLGEFVMLLPALLLAVVGYYVASSGGELSDRISEALHDHTRVWSFSMMRSWSPQFGLATAASGFVVAGAIGWTVRIVFTLVFGREAFGTGDIHLMAAAGCIAGWPVVVLGFILTCGLAVLGWLLSLPYKKTRAIPLGPWLSLAFLIVVVFYDTIVQWPIITRAIAVADMLFLGE